jgi:glycosyltransferase involved in cell wall biosynthesis
MAPNADLPSVTVALATHERRALLPRVLAPLLDDSATSEVVVVVDGSRDGSLELLRELAHDDSRVRPVFIEPSGRSRAQQAGIDRAESEIVLLLDDDVIAEPGLVSGHARHHVQAQGVVVVGYMPPILPEVRGPGEFATFLYAQEYEAMCSAYERDRDRVLRNLWGGNVSLRRDDLARVPLHWDDETSYHSDRDFGLRCRRAGLAGVFDRSLRARHLHTRSLEGFLRDARSQGAGHVRVHQLHRETIGELDLDYFETGSRYLRRRVVRISRSRLVRPLIAGALRAAVRIAGSLRRFSLETRAARLLRLIEQQRGAQELFVRQGHAAGKGTS